MLPLYLSPVGLSLLAFQINSTENLHSRIKPAHGLIYSHHVILFLCPSKSLFLPILIRSYLHVRNRFTLRLRRESDCSMKGNILLHMKHLKSPGAQNKNQTGAYTRASCRQGSYSCMPATNMRKECCPCTNAAGFGYGRGQIIAARSTLAD